MSPSQARRLLVLQNLNLLEPHDGVKVALKTLAGYPMKTNQGRMHGAATANYTFSKLPDQPQVYQTPSVFSHPGNSGLRLHSANGTTYHIERVNSLPGLSNWTAVNTVTLSSASQLLPDTRPTNTPPARFYRARRAP